MQHTGKSALHIKSITQFMNPVMGNMLPLTGRNSDPHGKKRAALAVARAGAAKPGAGSAAAQVCSHFSPKGKFLEDKIEKMLTWSWASTSCTCFLCLPGRSEFPHGSCQSLVLLTPLTRSKLQLLITYSKINPQVLQLTQ